MSKISAKDERRTSNGKELGKNWERTGKEPGKNWERTGKELGKNWERTGKELGKNWERTGKEPYTDLVTYLENISVTQCISGFAKIWTPTT
ncbi:MAG: hypothetical protein GY866_27925 [Proteobacteria bacterium]|nr:hypothetical protein [Pseudomonadota bacterium]